MSVRTGKRFRSLYGNVLYITYGQNNASLNNSGHLCTKFRLRHRYWLGHYHYCRDVDLGSTAIAEAQEHVPIHQLVKNASLLWAVLLKSD